MGNFCNPQSPQLNLRSAIAGEFEGRIVNGIGGLWRIDGGLVATCTRLRTG